MTRYLVRPADQFLADAPTLELGVDGEIGEVAAEGEIGEGPRDADEQAVGIACRDDDVGVPEHRFHAFGVVDRATFRERGSPQHVDEFFAGKARLDGVLDVGHRPYPIGMTTPTTGELRHLLDVAIEAARRGAAELERWRTKFKVREKGRADLVTDADHASQAAVKEVLLGAFPQHQFLGEEECYGKTLASVRPEPGGPPVWVVDPLDGTSNYVHDVPAYCVSIGLWLNGTAAVGVILDPRQNELFAAATGLGATLNGEPMKVSATALVRDSLISTGFPADYEAQLRNLEAWKKVSFHSQALRRSGSTALNLAYVACGRFDGYWAYDNWPWDVLGGAALILEAGGKVDSVDGSPFDPFRPDICATNGPTQAELLTILA